MNTDQAQTPKATESMFDAFIISNARETSVHDIVKHLETEGITTYIWTRDIALGDDWRKLEAQKLRHANTALIFLGNLGWGPNQLELAVEAQRLKKRIIPILIGDPRDKDLDAANALFRNKFHLKLQEITPDALARLVDAIRKSSLSNQPSDEKYSTSRPTPQSDEIIRGLIDGSEEQRSNFLSQIQYLADADKAYLARRLRTEIATRFGPQNEVKFGPSARDAKKLSSIRSWMLSVLIWADAEGPETRDSILNHVNEQNEHDRAVRFWTLASLYQCKASYLEIVTRICVSDSMPEVKALAQAISSPDSASLHAEFRSELELPEFVHTWHVLRVLRIVPIPEIATSVCKLIVRPIDDRSLIYDALYALTHPVMAKEAAEIISNDTEIETFVSHVVTESRDANMNAARNFSTLLAQFDSRRIDDFLVKAQQNRETAYAASTLQNFLQIYRQRSGTQSTQDSPSGPAVFPSSYFSRGDDLHLRRTAEADEICLNVNAYAGVLARLFRLNDPGEFSLAIFGPWGRGKTFLMECTAKIINDQHFIANLLLGSQAEGDQEDPNGQMLTGHFETVFFSAWKYPSRPEVWIHLYESIFQKLRSVGWWKSLAHVIRAGLERHTVGKLIGIWFALWFTALPKGWLIHGLDDYFRKYLYALDSSLAIASLIFAILFIYKFWKTKDVLEHTFLQTVTHAEKLGLQATIGADLRALLRGWIDVPHDWAKSVRRWPVYWIFVGVLLTTIMVRAGEAWELGLAFASCVFIPALATRIAFATASASPSRLLLVVDDLDRCPFDHLLSVVESIKLLVEESEVSRRVRVAILVEEDVLKHAIWEKYAHLVDTNASRALNTSYDSIRIVQENFEKLFTAHLRLAALTPDDVEEVVRAFAKPNPTNSDGQISTSPFEKSVPDAHPILDQKVQTPTSEAVRPIGLSIEQAAKVSGDHAPAPVTESLTSTSPLVSAGTDSNLTLSADEKSILCDELMAARRSLKSTLGPRSIRAFIFRYQLARLILEELGTPVRRKDEIVELTRLLAERCLFGNPSDDIGGSPFQNLAVVVQQVA